MDKTPVSFDVFALSPQGYEVHFQLNGEKVYEDAAKLLAALAKDGFTAKATHSGSNGNGADKLCPVHKALMRRYENGKGAWYSHKLEDGDLVQRQGRLAGANGDP